MASSMATAASIPAASVSLHPLASRNGHQSSTIVSVQVPQQTKDEHGLPPLEDIQATLDAQMLCDDQPQSSAHGAQQVLTPKIHPSDGDFVNNGHDGRGSQDSGLAAYAAMCLSTDDVAQDDDRVWGISHKNIEQYPVIDDQPAMCTCIEDDDLPSIFSVQDAPPIRAMTAAQLADLQREYNALDVPHSVVFPFLHGVDGSNAAQNHFFKAPLSGQPAPRYRGLTIVRADLPTPAQQNRMDARRKRTSSIASRLGMSCSGAGSATSSGSHSASQAAGRHGRADSAASSTFSSNDAASSSGANSSDGQPSSDEDHGDLRASNGRQAKQTSVRAGVGSLSTTGSSASISSSFAHSDESTHSLFSHDQHDSRFESHSSLATAPTECDEDMDCSQPKHPQDHSPPSLADSWDPQPDNCMLTSSLYPYELISPPLMVDRRSRTCYHARPGTRPRRHDSAMIQTAHFVQPNQVAGVNLRNFKIQAVKYATVSDIVVYCPAGYHEGLLTTARWFRDAHEGSYDERCERRLGGLRYNVFVVTEPFEAFEANHPNLIALDRRGISQNRVDFIDREREEMQRLTAAAPIDENVWLGCTGDVPAFCPDLDIAADGGDSGWTSVKNPHEISVCIEFHEQGETPDADKLAEATQRLDRLRTNVSRDASASWDDASPSPSLVSGQNGWALDEAGLDKTWPSNSKMPQSSQVNLPLSTDAEQSLDESDMVHLECHSFSADPKITSSLPLDLRDKVEQVLRLCNWIRDVTHPPKTSPQSTRSGHLGNGMIGGAFKGVQNARYGSPSSVGRAAGRHTPRDGAFAACSKGSRGRRVLLHCGDGYTETSIMALAYLMFAKGMSLPEAYLDLQERAQRSFFVYSRDLPLLKELERQISNMRNEGTSSPVTEHSGKGRSKHSFPWLINDDGHSKRRNNSATAPRRNSASSLSPEAHEHNSWMRGLVGWVGSSTRRGNPQNASSDTLTSPPSRTVTPTPASMASKSSSSVALNNESAPSLTAMANGFASDAWFNNERFEGSFPSRILPFLYLGNLNHALNAAMLHALGITHVVSVGESALHPPAASGCAVADSQDGQTRLPSPAEPEGINALWHEQQAGRISVLDLKNVSDDGIDPLRATMRLAVEYIEAARRAGGKVLVHCRVGVSRSTTIVLAYVMAHLDLTLVESYLLVRSRRLSILIQPHLLFFWELRGWETYLASQKLKRRLSRDGQGSTPGLTDADVSMAGLSLHSEAGRGELMHRIASVGSSCGFGANSESSLDSDRVVRDDLDVDIGAGAGSPYQLRIRDAAMQPFGSGSPGGLPADSLRLNWGFLCREITALNERYF